MKQSYPVREVTLNQGSTKVSYKIWPTEMIKDLLAEGYDPIVLPPAGGVKWLLAYFCKDGKTLTGMMEPEDYETIIKKK